MIAEDFEKLIADAGLNLLSRFVPRFLVSLHVEQEFGVRVQCGCVEFDSEKAFRETTTDEASIAVDEIYARLLQASETQQGDVAKGGTLKVITKTKNVDSSTAINYPAH